MWLVAIISTVIDAIRVIGAYIRRVVAGSVTVIVIRAAVVIGMAIVVVVAAVVVIRAVVIIVGAAGVAVGHGE